MKKFFAFVISLLIFTAPIYAKPDKTSEDYLKNKHHFAIMNPVAEKIAQKIIKKALKKEAKGKYKVQLDGYNLYSLKKGIFKYLKITGKNIDVNDIKVPYMKMFTSTDYNWIDYSQNPVVFKSDMIFDYEMHLSEETINKALESDDYQKKLQKVNKLAYPLFTLYNIRVNIKEDRLYILMEYNFPIKPARRNKTFKVSSKVNIVSNKLKLSDISMDEAYGKLPLDKVANLVNLVDPLSFTLDLIDNKNCDGRLDSIKIDNNIIKINGRIYIKKEG